MGYFGRVEVGGALVWVGGVGRECLGHYFRWAVVSGGRWTLFWVGGAGWGWVEVDGGVGGGVHCLIMPNFFIDSVKMEVSLANTKKMRLPILLIL